MALLYVNFTFINQAQSQSVAFCPELYFALQVNLKGQNVPIQK